MQPKIPASEVYTIGGAIRWYRTFRGMTQADLSYDSDVSQNVICRVENGSNITLTSLWKLCRALHVSLADLATLARV